VGEAMENLGDHVANLGEGVNRLGESIAALPQTVSEAVEEAFQTELRANVETKAMMANALNLPGTLVTASHEGDADVKVGVKAGIANVCGASVSHDVIGTIEAGVDLSKVQPNDFVQDSLESTWSLVLDGAQLHSCRIDYIRQYGFSVSLPVICHQDWDAYRILAETVAKAELREKALVAGLLDRAEQQAARVLGNFMSTVTGNDNIIVSFRPKPSVAMQEARHVVRFLAAVPPRDSGSAGIFSSRIPPSCKQAPFVGWKYDEVEDTWERE